MIRLIFFIFIFTTITNLNANSLSDEALFNRCYAHLTGLSPLYNHPNLVAVRSGANPIDECMKIFDKALLNTSGGNEGLLQNTNDQESIAILNRFYHFFRGWFKNKSNSWPQAYAGGRSLVDPAEPALHLVRSMFREDIPYSDIVKGTQSFKGKRQKYRQHESGTDFIGGIETGKLLGVTVPYAPSGFSGDINKTFFGYDGTPVDKFAHKWNQAGCGEKNHGTASNIKIANGDFCQTNRSFGGGLLGSLPFIMNNSIFESAKGANADGGIKAHRLWSEEALNSLLCRYGPYMRTTDVSSAVIDYASAYPGSHNYKLPFRESSVCMGCHLTQDALASASRRIRFMSAGTNSIKLGPTKNESLAFVYSSDVVQPAEGLDFHLVNDTSGQPGYVKDYWRRPAHSKLTYRDFRGNIVDVTITDPQDPEGNGIFNEVGKAFSAQDDFYVCASKRVFSFFTNVDVPLGDPGVTSLTEDDKYYKNIVENLGMNLKNHQSLRSLVKEIISLSLYRNERMRDTK